MLVASTAAGMRRVAAMGTAGVFIAGASVETEGGGPGGTGGGGAAGQASGPAPQPVTVVNRFNSQTIGGP